MGLSIYNIKKWTLMLTGKSVLHVNQDIGKLYSTKEIKGYYNNLTEKVTMVPECLESEALPLLKIENGDEVEFPVAIFQYGLGAYDLYLQKKEEKYKNKFLQCCQWALNRQEKSGAWSNFFYVYPDNPYGAMCQGEGTSLLLRGYIETKDERYLVAAGKAIDFMLESVEDGGCSIYEGNNLILLEYTHLPAVMNGWIFALFGLYDFTFMKDIDKKYERAYTQTLNTLIEFLPRFTNPYWSMYDLGGKIASPFYHNLHIAQMEALYDISGEKSFQEYAGRWRANQESFIKKNRAFIKKAFQKVKEK